MGSSLIDGPSFLYISGPVKTAFDYPLSRILSYNKRRVHIKRNFPFPYAETLCVCGSELFLCVGVSVSLSVYVSDCMRVRY